MATKQNMSSVFDNDTNKLLEFKLPCPTTLRRRIQLLEMTNFGTSVYGSLIICLP